MSEITVQNAPGESRYEILVDGELGGVLDYAARPDGTVDLQHTVVLPSHRGQGLAAQLVQGALDDVRARGGQALASCGYVQSWLPEHPEYQDLITAAPAD